MTKLITQQEYLHTVVIPEARKLAHKLAREKTAIGYEYRDVTTARERDELGRQGYECYHITSWGGRPIAYHMRRTVDRCG